MPCAQINRACTCLLGSGRVTRAGSIRETAPSPSWRWGGFVVFARLVVHEGFDAGGVVGAADVALDVDVVLSGSGGVGDVDGDLEEPAVGVRLKFFG
ncbi:hypothetical protein ACFPRL_30645 [Pseudoclavibacter helvolus]